MQSVLAYPVLCMQSVLAYTVLCMQSVLITVTVHACPPDKDIHDALVVLDQNALQIIVTCMSSPAIEIAENLHGFWLERGQ